MSSTSDNHKEPCPNCGYCPTCGRSNKQAVPLPNWPEVPWPNWPQPYINPYETWVYKHTGNPPIVTFTSTGTSQ